MSSKYTYQGKEISSDLFSDLLTEYETAWNKNQAALDELTEEIGDEGFAKIDRGQADDALLGKYYRWNKLGEEEQALKATELPSSTYTTDEP